MLMVHYDTVFGEGTAAERPFTVAEGRATGPGVGDAKGGVAVILHTVDLLDGLGFDGYGQLTVLLNPDEEMGSLGSRELIGELAARQDYALSFEPTFAETDTPSVTIVTKGINYAFLDVKGRASHAGGAPKEGRNAVIELAHQLLQLNDLGNEELGTTLNWTIVSGGTKRNIIPEQASAEGDMRYFDFAEYDRVLEEANGIVADKLIDDTEVSFRLDRGRPPLPPNDATAALADRAVAILRRTRPRADQGRDRRRDRCGLCIQSGFRQSRRAGIAGPRRRQLPQCRRVRRNRQHRAPALPRDPSGHGPVGERMRVSERGRATGAST